MTKSVNRGGWIVYLNGIECPAISAQIRYGVWTMPAATVAFPADRVINRIGKDDRVRLTIFAIDPHRAREENNDPVFRLAFDGEIHSYNYSSTGSGRAINYTAVDFISGIKKMFPYIVKNLNTIVAGQTSVQSGVLSIGNPLAPTYSLLTSGFSGQAQVKRPFDFVRNMLNFLAGVDLPVSDQSEVIKQWFIPWTERTGFVDRFVPSAFIEDGSLTADMNQPAVFPILEAVQRQGAFEAVAQAADNVPSGSFYDIMQSVFQTMYYELLMLPTAPVVHVNKTEDVIHRETAESGTAKGITKRVANYITKPQTIFGLPPKFNVFWPSMVEQFQYDEDFQVQPTRTYLGDPHIINAMARGVVSDVITRGLTVGYPPVANERVAAKRNDEGDGKGIHNFITPEEYYKGPVYNNMQTPQWFMHLAKERAEDRSSNGLQYKFCKYEHLRTKSSYRNAGVVGPYNPYVVPGCPGFVVDNEHAANHVYGYITNVSQSFTQDSMTTQVGMSHAIPLAEMLDLLDTRMGEDAELDLDATSVITMPEHPIRAVRERFQILNNADDYYVRMFYSQTGVTGDAVFNALDAFGVLTEDNGVEPLKFDPVSRQKFRSSRITSEPADLRLLGTWRQYINDAGAAFAYASRPICTLEEYIDSLGDRGVREGLRNPEDPREGKGAPYYVRIWNPKEDNRDVAGVDLDGNPCDTSASDQSRDWPQRLLAYRNRIYAGPGGYRG